MKSIILQALAAAFTTAESNYYYQIDHPYYSDAGFYQDESYHSTHSLNTNQAYFEGPHDNGKKWWKHHRYPMHHEWEHHDLYYQAHPPHPTAFDGHPILPTD